MRHFAVILLLISSAATALAQWMPPNSPPVEYVWHEDATLCNYMFISTHRSISPSQYKPTNLILDEKGHVVWWQKSNVAMLDFKIHANGLISYEQAQQYFILDSTFNVIDTVECVGLNTDVHELVMTADGHYFIPCTEDSIMDLSHLNTRDGVPGDTATEVHGSVVQELDAQKNLVRDWHAFEHFDVEDVDSVFFRIPNRMELNHINSIFVDDHGGVLMSMRFNHELTYVDWATGELIWRFGGGPNNEFALVNDIGINSQHFGQFLPDGQVSVFDNGTYHAQPAGRGVVYTLDTVNMTAMRTWEYAVPNMISSIYGSFQVRENGDALINFGGYSPLIYPNVVYVRPNGDLVWEMHIEDLYWTYRAFCLDIPFDLGRPEVYCREEAGQVYLGTDSTNGDFLWQDYSQNYEIAVTDTGNFQVFVRKGIGWIGSEVYHVSDVNAPCSAIVDVPEVMEARPKPVKSLGIYDLWGRKVERTVRGKIYIERFSDGNARKFVVK
ncbi:MAG: aryl-sulfate sulfotransferase [Bacteroidota bacterium]